MYKIICWQKIKKYLFYKNLDLIELELIIKDIIEFNCKLINIY